MERMVVKPETALVRPFVVCAILRGVTLDKSRYTSFIDLQVINIFCLSPYASSFLLRCHGLEIVQADLLKMAHSSFRL